MKSVPMTIAAALLPLSALAACSSMGGDGDVATGSTPAAATLSGSATYRQRVALPPDARLVIAIEDVSLADAPSTTIASVEVPANGRQVPLPFSLDYDRSKIEPRHSYAVSARILAADGGLLWITDTRNPLPPAGQRIDLILVSAR